MLQHYQVQPLARARKETTTMSLTFKKATKEQAKLRLALIGLAGSGKTYSALSIASHLVPDGKIAVIDTERGSASLYADRFSFDVLDLERHGPEDYCDAIEAAEQAGYDVIVVDSLSHAWAGRDGALEQVDKIAKREGKSNNFTAWRDVTPKHNRLVDAMLSCKSHLIATIRSKMEYVLEKDEKTGKSAPRKVGLAPIQRDGLDYEFTVVGDMNLSHELLISKSRCSAIGVGDIIDRPGEKMARTLRNWLNSGAAPVERPAPAPMVAPSVTAPAVENTTVADAVDRVFADYLDAMRGAGDLAELDRVATGPGRPAKGTPQHKEASDAYLARKNSLEQQKGAAA
jgi:nucleoside-triphosphatase THEP1